jgi:flavin-dependent trigonelline monooxygenase, oxygenase component
MKFQLAINLERMDDRTDMKDVARHTLEMVQMADRGGFNIVWAAEHHALEMTIAPNPFSILAWWASHTDRIRLGTACVAAAYWHPIKVAGEAAFLDLISGGRLEFGIGSGAYQREFDRMHPGLKQPDGWRYMQEMLPAVRALWQGDYEHKGELWSFPTSTSCPKPLQSEVPVWIAARAPMTYDYAVKNGCNIMSWPLTREMSEAELYMSRMADAMAANPGKRRPIMAMMRQTAVYERLEDWMVPVRAAQNVLSQFENLFKNTGEVTSGFPKAIPLDQLAGRPEYDPEMLSRNLMLGTPDQVIAKLKLYEALGVDEFIYYASFGLGHAEQKRSMELFCSDVIPAFS